MSGFDGTEIADLLYNSRPSATERTSGADLKDIRESYWQYVDDNLECMEWLRKFNCLPYYRKHKNRFMYDPKQNRLVFLVKEGDKFVDGAGRGLGNFEGPKWYRYGSSGLGFFAEHKLDLTQRILDPLVIVEDAASACSMSRVYSAYALLGTNLTTQQLIFLNTLEYTDIVIALDKDAIVNATEVVSELGSFGYNVNVVQLRDDAKYLSVDEIKSSLKFT